MAKYIFMDINGLWKGYYEYGGGYTLPQFGERVQIEVVFKGSNEKFNGYVNEIKSVYSVPLKATIQGFLEGSFISFIKTYPKTARIKEVGGLEILFEEGETKIEHEGIMDVENNAIYGKWYISELLSDEKGEYELNSDGIWYLKKH